MRKQKQYNYPKEIVVNELTQSYIDKLYEAIKDDNNIASDLIRAERTTEPRIVELNSIYGTDAVNLMTWVIKNDKFESITEVKKKNDKQY